ncbi:hypothetical protein LX95_02364 [Mesonia algae]|uniref:Uncharacterized protein n=1 Tax=Mesonia algae TaxID=213248 RepID=A0A2W7I1B3_9FLAO|nr:hypothetical protein [Mesonia algae]PZW39222.1 hypothetical protein LX95_02364 [Mesonia algae]
MTLKNTKLFSFVILIALGTLTLSCKDDKSNPEEVQKEETTPQKENTTPENDAANPPHGEAGHRCDIPVGAPLNSKPANQQQQIQVNGNPVQQQARKTENTNPPHGEPGHDCGIPVGAPLKK